MGRSPLPAGECGGPFVSQYFDDFSGDDARLDYSEAKELAQAVGLRLDRADACGLQEAAAASKAALHTCWAYATKRAHLEPAEMGRFVGCLVGHESATCRATVCVPAA